MGGKWTSPPGHIAILGALITQEVSASGDLEAI